MFGLTNIRSLVSPSTWLASPQLCAASGPWLVLVRSGSGTPQATPGCSEPWLLPTLLTPLELHFQIFCCLANILVTERHGLLVPIAVTSSECALVLSVKPQGTTASAEDAALSGGHCPLLGHFLCCLWPSLPAACARGNT